MDSKSEKPIPISVCKSKLITSLPLEISDEIKNGSVLAGDDYNEQQLRTWFSQEQEAFYRVDDGNKESTMSETDPWYAYMRFQNELFVFSRIEKLPSKPKSILLLGPGSGIEVERFAADNPEWVLNFIEASDNFKAELKMKFPASYIVDPKVTGDISLEDNSQTVVCSFSVLHHLPNVSKIINEVARITQPGGLFFVREPCSSMGDWRYPRSATPNERGISWQLLVKMAESAGFEIEGSPLPILFEPINKVLKKTIGFAVVPFRVLCWLDRFISWLLTRNDWYWRDTWYKKIGPSSYFYVFRKRGGS